MDRNEIVTRPDQLFFLPTEDAERTKNTLFTTRTTAEVELAGPESLNVPVSLLERVSSVDVIRGVALLGILVLNIQDFGDVSMAHDVPLGSSIDIFTGRHPHLDFIALLISWLFFEGKMRGLFSMLFGAGVVLLTSRAERRGSIEGADIYTRRNMWLMLAGILHGCLIWNGDILLDYGFEGLLFLYPLRRLKAKTLIWTGSLLTLFVAPFGIMLYINTGADYLLHHRVAQVRDAQRQGKPLDDVQRSTLKQWERRIDAKTPNPVEIQKEVAKHVHQSYFAGVAERTQFELWSFFARLRLATILDCVPAMLLGMGLMKIGFFSLELETTAYLWTAFLGFAISLPLYTIGILKVYSSKLFFYDIETWLYGPYYITREAGSLAIAATILLLIKAGWLPSLQRALAAVGRTAFSNYLLTSIICQTIFVWGPYPLYAKLEYYQLAIVVVAVWLFNLIFSSVWLRFFAYGPFEWLWRSLTYWKTQPILLAR